MTVPRVFTISQFYVERELLVGFAAVVQDTVQSGILQLQQPNHSL